MVMKRSGKPAFVHWTRPRPDLWTIRPTTQWQRGDDVWRRPLT